MMEDKKLILAQMDRLWKYAQLSRNVNTVNHNIYKDERTIGVRSEKVRFNSYIDSIRNIIKNKEYAVNFIDGSMVNFWYEFDQCNNCCTHSLSYIPYYKDDSTEETEDANIDENEFRERVSRYIRIDFDETGRTEYCHSLIHLHMGPGRNSIRIPVDSVVYPNDFMFFVLNYIYGEGLDPKHFERRKEEEVIRAYLTEAEKRRTRIAFL